MDINEIIGFIAAFCTTIAFLPQAVKTWRSRSAKDISLPMFLIFNTGVALWLYYGITLHSWPIIISNIFTQMLGLTILYFKLKYK